MNMKLTILTFLALAMPAFAQPVLPTPSNRTVAVDTNGLLTAPAPVPFWTTNFGSLYSKNLMTNSTSTEWSTALQAGGIGLNVKWYGALGDGTNDDTAAIQATIDAAKTQKKSVFVPAGLYMISSQLVVSNFDSFELIAEKAGYFGNLGVYRGSWFVADGGLTNTVDWQFDFEGVTMNAVENAITTNFVLQVTRSQNVKIAGLGIWCKNKASGLLFHSDIVNHPPLYPAPIQNVVIEHVQIYQPEIGLKLVGEAPSYDDQVDNFLVQNVIMHECKYYGIHQNSRNATANTFINVRQTMSSSDSNTACFFFERGSMAKLINCTSAYGQDFVKVKILASEITLDLCQWEATTSTNSAFLRVLDSGQASPITILNSVVNNPVQIHSNSRTIHSIGNKFAPWGFDIYGTDNKIVSIGDLYYGLSGEQISQQAGLTAYTNTISGSTSDSITTDLECALNRLANMFITVTNAATNQTRMIKSVTTNVYQIYGTWDANPVPGQSAYLKYTNQFTLIPGSAVNNSVTMLGGNANYKSQIDDSSYETRAFVGGEVGLFGDVLADNEVHTVVTNADYRIGTTSTKDIILDYGRNLKIARDNTNFFQLGSDGYLQVGMAGPSQGYAVYIDQSAEWVRLHAHMTNIPTYTNLVNFYNANPGLNWVSNYGFVSTNYEAPATWAFTTNYYGRQEHGTYLAIKNHYGGDEVYHSNAANAGILLSAGDKNDASSIYDSSPYFAYGEGLFLSTGALEPITFMINDVPSWQIKTNRALVGIPYTVLEPYGGGSIYLRGGSTLFQVDGSTTVAQSYADGFLIETNKYLSFRGSDGSINSIQAGKWKEIFVSPFAMHRSTNDGSSNVLFDTYFNGLKLDSTNSSTNTFIISIPTDYKQGSEIYPFVKWTQTNAPTATGTNVTWVTEYNWGNIDQPITNLVRNIDRTSKSTEVALTNLQVQVTEFGSLSNTNINIGSIITFNLIRAVASTSGVFVDNFTNYVFVLGAGIKYEADSIGSATRWAK
jgi:hypothetical protein